MNPAPTASDWTCHLPEHIGAAAWRRAALTVLLACAAALPASCLINDDASLAILLLGLVAAVAVRAPLLRVPGSVPILAFLVWAIVSTIAAIHQGIPHVHRRPPPALLFFAAIPLLATAFTMSAIARRWALRLTLAAFATTVSVAALQFCLGYDTDYAGNGHLIAPDGRRFALARGFTESHLTFGLSCSLIATMALGQPAAWGIAGVWRRIALSLSAVGLLICGSRSAVIGGAAGIMATLALRGRRWLIAGVILALLGVLAVAGRMYLSEPGRFANTMAGKDGRWPIWSAATLLISENPVLGLGGKGGFKGSYPEAFDRANPPGTHDEFPDGVSHPHNTVLALAAQYGIPAVLLYGWIWFAALRWLWKRRHEAPAAWQAGIGCAGVLLVGGMFESYPVRDIQSSLLHCALGTALAMGATARDGQPA